eukprot:gene18376-20922_t
MDRTALSVSAVKGLFLGSTERFIVGGNCPSASVQVLQSLEQGSQKLGQAANLHLNGVCSDLELCGVPRLAQTFAAVATYSEHGSGSSISMLNVETYHDSTSLAFQSAEALFKDTFNITSISFCSDLELMAVGSESGAVSIIDLYSGKEVSRVKVDPCGVAKVKFTRTGQLVTVGQSSKSQIKIWDLKASAVGNNSPAMVLSQQLERNEDTELNTWNATQGGPRARPGRTTCVSLHPVQEKLVSGTSQGTVQVWDLRSAACLSFAPHTHAHMQPAAVTDVQVHPRRLDTVLSSSTDGTVRSFDSNNSSNSNSNHFNGFNSRGALTVFGNDAPSEGMYQVICSDPGAINSMDCDNSSDTCVLLAVSSTGSAIRVAI